MKIAILLLSVSISSFALSDDSDKDDRDKLGLTGKFVSPCRAFLRDKKCFKNFFFVFVESNVHRNRRCIRYVFNYFQCEQSYMRTKVEELEDRLEELEGKKPKQ